MPLEMFLLKIKKANLSIVPGVASESEFSGPSTLKMDGIRNTDLNKLMFEE